MSPKKNEELRVMVKGSNAKLCPVRLSFVHLLEPYKPEGSNAGKYSVDIMIPKKYKEVLDQLKSAYDCAYLDGVQNKWNGTKPSTPAPFKNGDDQSDKYPEFAGHIRIAAKTYNKPTIYGLDPTRPEKDQVYSGMWAAVVISFYPYNVNGAKGVSVGLDGIAKVDDDECFGGGSVGASAFDCFGLKPQAPAADDPLAGLI